MSTLIQPGRHPDAEQLSAFAEHELPAHEQQETLAHLAGCAECRAAVFLAREAAAQEDALGQGAAAAEAARAQGDIRGWAQLENWLSGWRLALPALGLACLLLVTLYMRRQPAPGGQGAATAMNGRVESPLAGPATMRSEAADAGGSVGAKTGAAHRWKRPAAIGVEETKAAGIVAPADEAAETGPVPAAAPAAVAQGAQPALQMRRSAVVGVAEGGVTGTISDPKGLGVAHATVTATNTDTGARETRTTNAEGNYSIAPLQPGNYNVEVVATGFKRLLQESVTVGPTTIARMDQRLMVGGADTTVTITDAPPLLDTADATIGGTIENQLYANLPLTMNRGPRDPTAFQYLMPGTQENPANITVAGAGAAGAANGNSGIYGGTGQTNLNQNYVNGVPVNTVGQQGNNKAISGAGMASARGEGMDAVGGFSLGADAGGAARARQMAVLPSKLPAISMVEGGGWTLAVDSARAVFRSQDGGVTWERVAAQWQGLALTVRLAQPAFHANQPAAAAASANAAGDGVGKPAMAVQPAATTAAGAVFELTTDAGVVYASRDGLSWERR